MPYRPPVRAHRHQPRQPGGVIFVIGLIILFMNHAIWPGILVLFGLSALANEIARGRPQKGALALLWLGGMAILFSTGAFWPGIFILFFLHWMFSGGRW
jgi:hypothetical protein